MARLVFLLFLLALTGCSSLMERLPFMGKKLPMIGGVYRENFDADRLVDLNIVRKLTGAKIFYIFPKYTTYLEGYIRGAVVDYDDTPIEGIVVRIVEKGRDLPGYDPGISDANGVYRIRFSHPIKKDVVDVRGAISYNPPWSQQLDLLGTALEPQTKETKFRLYYNQKMGIIAIGEDIPKTITRRVTGTAKSDKEKQETDQKSKPGAPGKDVKKVPGQPATAAPAQQKKADDFFGSFGDFGN